MPAARGGSSEPRRRTVGTCCGGLTRYARSWLLGAAGDRLGSACGIGICARFGDRGSAAGGLPNGGMSSGAGAARLVRPRAWYASAPLPNSAGVAPGLGQPHRPAASAPPLATTLRRGGRQGHPYPSDRLLPAQRVSCKGSEAAPAGACSGSAFLPKPRTPWRRRCTPWGYRNPGIHRSTLYRLAAGSSKPRSSRWAGGLSNRSPYRPRHHAKQATTMAMATTAMFRGCRWR